MHELGNDLFLRTLVTAAQTDGDVSVTWVQLAGRHRPLRTARSTRIYATLTGTITMQLGAEESVEVHAGQLCVVPRGVAYRLWGTGTYLVINSPAFVPGDDIYLDDEHAPASDADQGHVR